MHDERRAPAVDHGDAIAAVVVTYNRADVLRATLVALRDQERAPGTVVVVDNCSTDATAAMVTGEFPALTYHRLPENLGFGAGLAAGMAVARRQGYRWFWLLDDDTRPAPDALRRCLEAAGGMSRPGILGLTGGVLRWGSPEYSPQARAPLGFRNAPPAVADSDWVHLDGALVSRDAVDQLGYPRSDFFMMLEDVEYSNRLKRAGWDVARFELDEALIDRGNLGSGGDGRPSPPWRGYYQTRNQLSMAIDHRSLGELAGWLYRQVKLVVATALLLDSKVERIRLRGLGAWHALRGVRGRTVEPSH